MQTIMVRKVILTILCLSALGAVRADEKSDVVLKRIESKLSEYDSYEVLFDAAAGDMMDVSGSYIVSGFRYRITVDEQVHFSDGVNRYEIHDGDREVVIDRADLSSRNIFSNPARAFEFAGEDFEGTWLRREEIAGRECDVIQLLPRRKGYGSAAITLYAGVKEGLPVAVTYDYDGEQVDIAIVSINRLDSVDDSLFEFREALYPGYEIIDFR